MCNGCKADHARDWAIRAYHESQMHEQSSFINPTYSPEKLPPHGTLDPRDLQLFFKRLRKKIGPFRYFAAGEYGEKRLRPHYHICLFGWRPPDGRPIGVSSKGNIQYMSDILESAWGYGHITWSDFAPNCARYTAHYTASKLKKFKREEIDPETGLRPYERLDATTGEIIKLVPEFQRQSLKPGIGMPWLKKYWREVFPSDEVIMDGRQYPPPKAYWEWLKKHHPETAKLVMAKRIEETKDRPYETGLRMYQKANAKDLQLSRLVRPTHKENV